MNSTTFPQSEWDEVPISQRGRFLRSRGVPMNDDGTWKDGYSVGIRMIKEGNEVCWEYSWSNVAEQMVKKAN